MSHPEHQPAIAAVIQAEQELAEAHRNLNLAVFERLLHPDYALIQPGGRIEGKAETIASLQSGGRHWEIARSDQLDVRIYGDTAVVIGRWRGKGRNTARFLSVWVREHGRGATSRPNPRPFSSQRQVHPLRFR
jgi:ketosteroid isomerase-like protein